MRSPEVVRAQEGIAAAVMVLSRRPSAAKRWQWLRAPRHALLVGAVIAGLGGSVAAAASLLNAYTGYYPTRHGVPVNMSGPGEALNTAAPNFCRAALEVSSDIPFPNRYASWRDYVLTLDFGIKHPSSSIPCSARGPLNDGRVTTGWLGSWFATTAFCGWAQAWAQDVGAGNRPAAARDARAILGALDWRAVRWVDPHPDSAPAGDAPGGDRTKTTFGWMLFYQQAVRSGSRARMESLLDGHVGYGDRSFGYDECQSGPDPDIANFVQAHPRAPLPKLQKLLLAHLRREGI
ncbi:MAG: hypothetical protein ACRDNJ_16240 [Solirubrobacteraceae bacterium]